MSEGEEFRDYYEILGVEFGCSIEEIKTTFRRLAKKYHPDVSSDQDGRDFKLIVEAYKVLSDQKSRDAYDRKYLQKKAKVTGKQNRSSSNVIDPSRVEYKLSLLNLSKAGFDLSKRFSREDFLEELGEDLVVYLTDKEVEEGSLLVIKLPARTVCPVCYGANRNCYRCDGTGYITTLDELKVPIPPNVKHSEIINIDLRKGHRNKGNAKKFVLRELKMRVKWLSLVDLE